MCSFDSHGRYLSLADEEFTHNVYTDIKEFIEKELQNSVLLFPPVNNYRRFLVHDACENIKTRKNSNIVSFSIGEKYQRRTVICFEHQIINKSFLKKVDDTRFSGIEEGKAAGAYSNFSTYKYKDRSDRNMGIKNLSGDENLPHRGGLKSNCIALYRPPAARATNPQSHNSSTPTEEKNTISFPTETKSETTNNPIQQEEELNKPEEAVNETLTNKIITKRLRERRPDRAVYIPRAKRSQTTPTYKILPETVQPPISTNENIIQNSNNKQTEISTTDSLKNLNLVNKTTTSICKEKKQHNNIVNSDDAHVKPLLNNIKQEKSKQLDQNFTYHQEKNQNNLQNFNLVESKTTTSPILDMNKSQKLENMDNNNPLRIEETTYKRNLKEENEELEFRRASQEINRSNRRIIKQTFNDNVLSISDQTDGSPAKQNPQPILNSEENDWEELYNDNGDCLDIKVMEDLSSAVGKVNIEKPKFNYANYEIKQEILNNEEFPHVLEVSNFPVEFKTQDLMMLFMEYKESGFDIKWVDDTHALAVFSSSRIAAEVLAMNHPFVQLKPLAKATIESRTKAKKSSSHLQPYRQRPETCAALARRLVTGALGVKLKTSREERENERRVLKEAKEKKLLAAKQQKEMWEG